LLAGSWVGRAISAAAGLGVADLVAAGPRTIAELGATTHTDELALYRLMRALASVGIFAEIGERQRRVGRA
jgi:hypothetical protein